MSALLFNEKTKRLLADNTPFLFIINFDKSIAQAFTFEEAAENGIFFTVNGKANDGNVPKVSSMQTPTIDVKPFPFESYLKGFENVVYHLKKGNSFLVNLTFPSKLKSSADLSEIYQAANAPYKLLYQHQFVCFSPESFIKIKGDCIYSYPMKGTIDATIENAQEILLSDPKEQQEHNTIVDLIRNDISMVAREVEVLKFRYLQKIKTAKGEIWQTSSEIRGRLQKDWKTNFGNLLLNMLPAGSISGAPKPQTLKIIQESENYERGFYTGVFGIFDGEEIDCGVAIRFIEKVGDAYWYKSGGGITHQSNVKEEYIELIKKIYIPTV